MDNTRLGKMTWIAVVLVVLATVLGTITAGDGTLESDVRVARQVQRWQGNLPEALEAVGDMSGETITAIIAVLGGITIALLARAGRIAAFLAGVGVFRALATALKPTFDSPRPLSSQVRIQDFSDGFGYPSGHSITAAMIATMAIVIAWNTPLPQRYRGIVAVGAVAMAGLVGWSRVWSGAHWPTDVIGGWSYGAGLVLLGWVITTRIARSRSG